MQPAEWVQRAVDDPPPRFVDWSLLLFVTAEVVTGFVSFTVGTPSGWPVFWLHRMLGFGIVVLLCWKLLRVRQRLTNPSLWRKSTAVSVLLLVSVLGALGTGVLWIFGLDVRLSYWTLLSIHVGFGLATFVLVVAHVGTRFRKPRRADFEARRTTIQYSAMLIGGAVVYRLQQSINHLLETPGTNRRFTGSYPREGEGNGSFPVTSWVADDPDPIDTDTYELTITGLVAEPVSLSVDDLDPDCEHTALLDCTSGWYTVQDWGGQQVEALFAAAGGAQEDAAYVRFVSVTGYRWSLPIEEAREALVATHVGGEQLSHGHGAPARLVAPGRRGFQWVKWIERIELRRNGDPAQWVVTLISGFD